jgi:hypothetical protein
VYPHRHHGLDGKADRGEIDGGMRRLQHTFLLECPHPVDGRRRRNVELFGQDVVGDPGIAGELPQDLLIEGIDFDPMMTLAAVRRQVHGILRGFDARSARLRSGNSRPSSLYLDGTAIPAGVVAGTGRRSHQHRVDIAGGSS